MEVRQSSVRDRPSLARLTDFCKVYEVFAGSWWFIPCAVAPCECIGILGFHIIKALTVKRDCALISSGPSRTCGKGNDYQVSVLTREFLSCVRNSVFAAIMPLPSVTFLVMHQEPVVTVNIDSA